MSPTGFCQGPAWKPRQSSQEPGTCGACGKPLEGRALWFCRSPRGEAFFNQGGNSCRARYMANHGWGEARRAAIKRDGGCVRCGSSDRLEVNHIVPRNGQGYAIGCWNHLDNLETLCHAHHLEVTKMQRWPDGNPREQKSRARHERDLERLARWNST